MSVLPAAKKKLGHVITAYWVVILLGECSMFLIETKTSHRKVVIRPPWVDMSEAFNNSIDEQEDFASLNMRSAGLVLAALGAILVRRTETYRSRSGFPFLF